MKRADAGQSTGHKVSDVALGWYDSAGVGTPACRPQRGVLVAQAPHLFGVKHAYDVAHLHSFGITACEKQKTRTTKTRCR